MLILSRILTRMGRQSEITPMTKGGVLLAGLWCVFLSLQAVGSTADSNSIWIQVQDLTEVLEKESLSRVSISLQLASVSTSERLPFAHRLTILGVDLQQPLLNSGLESRFSFLAGMSPLVTQGQAQFREPLSTQSRFFALEAGIQKSFRFFDQVRLVPGVLLRSQIISQYFVGTQLRTQESIQSYPVGMLALSADIWPSGGIEVALTHDLFFRDQMRLGVFFQW